MIRKKAGGEKSPAFFGKIRFVSKSELRLHRYTGSEKQERSGEYAVQA